jgi:AdoMet-dependent heme synthase
MSAPTRPPAPAADPGAIFPSQPFHGLETLWLQVAGTLCNLACTHCFVSCGPGDRHHEPMTRAEVAERVAEGLAMGAREFYLTGGEPFLHRELLDILADTLPHGPCTVLTNGTLFTRERIAGLLRLSDASRHSLELRVSLDGDDAAAHDSFRGAGAYARTLDGLRACEDAGLLPIVTVTRPDDQDPLVFRERAHARLKAEGLRRPRLKVLPMFRLGREVARSRGYLDGETLAGLSADQFDPARLQCGSCRAVTARGVYVCPLLVDEPAARMGDTLAAAARPFTLAHGACLTCHLSGMTCANA